MRFAGSVRESPTPLAALGPLLVNDAVPVTVCPALTLAGKLSATPRSASTEPATVTLAALFPVLGSLVVADADAATVEVAKPGCV